MHRESKQVRLLPGRDRLLTDLSVFLSSKRGCGKYVPCIEHALGSNGCTLSPQGWIAAARQSTHKDTRSSWEGTCTIWLLLGLQYCLYLYWLHILYFTLHRTLASAMYCHRYFWTNELWFIIQTVSISILYVNVASLNSLSIFSFVPTECGLCP
jgi:hypothetical protein